MVWFTRRWITGALVMIGLTGCAGGMRTGPVTPEELESLDLLAEQHARDAGELTRIGIRFFEAGRLERAADVLGAALAIDPREFPAVVYRGLAFERLDQVDSARQVYRNAIARGMPGGDRRELEGRLTVLDRRQLRSEIRAVLAREATLGTIPAPPHSLAILPWTFVGSDSTLRPLERGIAHLLLTDLAKVSRLVLVERERVQVLLEEMAAGTNGRVDPATAARSGRLLGAAHVLQGVVRETADGRGVTLEAQVVRTRDGEVAATGRVSEGLSDLYAMEKAIVFQVIEQLGIPLSPAESREISERPRADLQAFLAFSRGLEAGDRGDWQAASAFFARAATRDPSLLGLESPEDLPATGPGRVETGLLAVPSIAIAGGSSTARRRSALLQAIQVIAPTSGGQLDRRTAVQSPLTRPRLPEALRLDDPGRLGIIGDIIIVIPRP